MGINIQMGGFFTAVERPQPALAISLGRGVITIAIALKLCTLIFGGEGIWLSQMVSEILCCVMTGVFVYQYRKEMRKG